MSVAEEEIPPANDRFQDALSSRWMTALGRKADPPVCATRMAGFSKSRRSHKRR